MCTTSQRNEHVEHTEAALALTLILATLLLGGCMPFPVIFRNWLFA